MVLMEIHRLPILEYHVKEAINTLSANLSFIGGDMKKILVTSALPGEGKTRVAVELVRALADQGKKVIFVDSDLRASAVQGKYGIRIDTRTKRDYAGLMNYLAGNASLDDIIGATNIPNAYMILAGKCVVNSLPLISSPRYGEMMKSLEKLFDIIIVDAPPVGTLIDAATIAKNCDGTLFVVKSGAVSRKDLVDALRQMDRAGSPVIGTVLNQYDEKKYGRRYYYYKKYSDYYDYGYGKETLESRSEAAPRTHKNTSTEIGTSKPSRTKNTKRI